MKKTQNSNNSFTALCPSRLYLTVYTHISAVAFSQIVGEVVLYLADELLGVLGVESEDLAEALEADILQVTIGQGFDISVGLDHLLLGQVV